MRKALILILIMLVSGMVAAQDDDTTITLDNADQLVETGQVNLGGAGEILAMAYAPVENAVYTGLASERLVLVDTGFDVFGGELILDGAVTDVDVTGDGAFIIATTDAGSLHFIDAFNGITQAVIEEARPLNLGRFHPEGTQAIAVNQNNLQVWAIDRDDTEFVGEPEVIRVYGGGFTDLAYSPDGSIIAAATANGAVQLWDSETLESLGEVAEGIDSGAVIAFNPAGTRLAVSTTTATTIYDTSTLQSVNDFREGGTDSVYTADGDVLVLLNDDEFTLVDVAFGTVVASYAVELDTDEDYSLTALALRADEIAIGTSAEIISFYGLQVDEDEAVVEEAEQDEPMQAQDDDADVDALIQEAQAAFDAGDFEAAIEAATQAIELDPASLPAYRIRANSYRQTANDLLAADDYTMVIELDPDDSAAYFYRGLSRYRAEFEDNEAILSDMNRAEELGFFDEAWLYNVRGLTHNRLGNYDLAIEDMTRAIDISPTYSSAVSNRAWILGESLGEWAASVPDRKTVLLELAPNSASSYNNLAWAYVQLEQFQEALDFVNIALDIEPDESNSVDTRGWAYLGLDEYDLAEAEFNRAIELGNAYSYWGLGELYAELGDIDRAIENLEIYIEEEGVFAEQEAIDLLNELTE